MFLPLFLVIMSPSTSGQLSAPAVVWYSWHVRTKGQLVAIFNLATEYIPSLQSFVPLATPLHSLRFV